MSLPAQATDTDAVTDIVRARLRTLRHELRTPINHIIGYSEMLQEESEDRGWLDPLPDLERIRSAGRHLLSFINDRFDPTRHDAGRIEPDMAGRELRTPLNAIIGYAQLLQEEAVDAGHDDVLPDLSRIETAARHLLGQLDAVLALGTLTPDPSPTPAGEGNSTPTLGEGSGVATATCAVSSTATVTASPPSPAGVGEGSGVRAPVRLTGRILVVDDNEGNRQMLARRLANDGQVVVLAAGGREALDRVAAARPDLVLLDLMMPDLSGYEVLHRLKADPATRDVPVIVLSALDELDDAVRCIQAGAEDYLPKPFEAVLLRARIESSLEKKRLRDREVEYQRRIEADRARIDELLHVILPPQVVDELKATGTVAPRRYDGVAVLFCDIVGFTAYCDDRAPDVVVADLERVVRAWEQVMGEHGLQKIKTIGDSFMATAGLLVPVSDPVARCLRAGEAMIGTAREREPGWDVRVGVHVGPVVAGVVGTQQYLFDLWGDTVNTAARIESTGAPGRITLSRAAFEQVRDQANCEPLGPIHVKGKGAIDLFRFVGFRRPDATRTATVAGG